MNTRSIRWQLPLSYAAIACLAAVALGAVLITILRDYYDRQEREYLERNAIAISTDMSQLLNNQIPPDMLSQHTNTLAFFAQARIRVFDRKGQMLSDSGRPGEQNWISIYYSEPVVRVQPMWDTVSVGPRLIQDVFLQNSTYAAWGGGGAIRVADRSKSGDSVISVVNEPLAQGAVSYEMSMQGGKSASLVSAIPATGTLYGFDLSGEDGLQADMEQRSDQQVQQVLLSSDGQNLGYVLLSEGPAYGTEIVESVARGWAMAGGIAVLLAATAGWFASQRISKPLLLLTHITSQMTEGNLSARASLKQRNELGILAASFNEMAERIEETITTLKRFVADAAHELHTPITALRTNLELVGEVADPALRRAQEQVVRLETLTNDLLDLSRIEAHMDRAEHTPVDVVALILGINEIYASRAEQADIDFVLDMPDDVSLILGNRTQLERMMANLLDNAIKFTPTNGTVKVRVWHEAPHLYVAVCDSGIGIPAEDLPRLFERFRRGRNSASYSGSGLGLAIVRAIVQGHHGTVEATSQPGETCIQVKFPIGSAVL